MIYTSYFAKKKNCKNTILVSIALQVPRDVTVDYELKCFMPTWDMVKESKATGNFTKYTEQYHKLMKDRANDVQKTISVLKELGKNYNVFLLCWEGKGKFCHRHLVADLLNEYGLDVREY